MTTSSRLMTADDLLHLPEDGVRRELIAGELIELPPPPGSQHGFVASNAGGILREFTFPRRLGAVFAAETGFIISSDPDTVRAPDAAFVAADRLPEGGIPSGYLRLAPDIVVEVVSPSDTAADVHSKVCAWLTAGARLVWVVYPDSRSVTVYRSMQDASVLGPDDTLDGAPVLEGFEIRVSELFE